MSYHLAQAGPTVPCAPVGLYPIAAPVGAVASARPRRRISDSASDLHDLRNVLAVVTSAANLLREGDAGHTRSRLCDAIEQAAASAYDIAESLVRQSSRACRFDICSAVLSLRPLYEIALPTGVDLRLDAAARACDVVADRRELERAVLNLVSNAGQACVDGGGVALRIRVVRDCVWLIVADNGSGIAPDLLARLGKVPMTTKAKGSGLGLTQAARFALACNGKLNIRSRVSQGTVVALILPNVGGPQVA